MGSIKKQIYITNFIQENLLTHEDLMTWYWPDIDESQLYAHLQKESDRKRLLDWKESRI